MATTDEELELEDPSDLGSSLLGKVKGITQLARDNVGQMDDVTKAGMLGFAVRMLSGGWGTGMQKFAGALGAGAESAGAQEAIQKTEAEKEKDRKSREGIAAQGRLSREEIAKLGAESRADAARIRGEYMLDRTRMNLEGKGVTPSVKLKYRTEARKIIESDPKNMALDNTSRETLIEDMASRMYDTDSARGLVPKSKGGGSEEPAASGAAAPATKDKKATTKTPSIWEDKVVTHPSFDKDFNNIEIRKGMIAKGYDKEVYAEEKKRGLPHASMDQGRPTEGILDKLKKLGPSVPPIDWGPPQ
jgi:hypothetical protein